MNRKQVVLLCVSAVALAAVCFFPPTTNISAYAARRGWAGSNVDVPLLLARFAGVAVLAGAALFLTRDKKAPS